MYPNPSPLQASSIHPLVTVSPCPLVPSIWDAPSRAAHASLVPVSPCPLVPSIRKQPLFYHLHKQEFGFFFVWTIWKF